MVAAALAADGVAVCAPDPAVAAWADAAYRTGCDVLAVDPARRHGGTWYVGVDALPNASDGSVAGVPLAGAWLAHVAAPARWHRAQLSVVFARYPRRDTDESAAAHRYRHKRDAAHVDGLLPEGPDKRRHLREPHAFIAGFPLNAVTASPLVVWKGSHKIMRAAFAAAYAGHPAESWGDIDVTEAYQAARRDVFARCERVEVTAAPGQVILLDRHVLHGVAPWADDAKGQMRMIAYFRPTGAFADWLG
jgi:hypothetical protein